MCISKMNHKLALIKHSLPKYKSTTAIPKTPKFSEKAENKSLKITAEARESHATKLRKFFKENPRFDEIKNQIPQKYLGLKQVTPDNLYLLDEQVAEKAVSYILPRIKSNDNQIVCEANAGFGHIASQLLKQGVSLVRLYNSCSEFQAHLKVKFESYRGRVEFFTKDIFLLPRYDYIDRQDQGNRIEQLLIRVPKKSWVDDPAMTIIGPLPSTNFIRFLMKSLVLQNYVISLGRLQIFAFMRARDYIVLTAGPHLNCLVYQRWSVLFRLLFDYEHLDTYPRNLFLPWQSSKVTQVGKSTGVADPEAIYLVQINFKRDLPVPAQNFLPLYAFVTQFFGRGRTRIIPTLEKWFPGVGLDIMIPKLTHKHYFKDFNIFTNWGELTPEEILAVFEEMITHPEYKQSHFTAIIESHLVKSETSIDEQLEKSIVESIEDKMD